MQSPERSSLEENDLEQNGTTALFLFDYDCAESCGSEPVFESVRACLEGSQGICALNDGGILSAKTLSNLAKNAPVKKEIVGRVIHTERYGSITPSVAAMWTDREENVDVFHDYLSFHSVRGYQGAFLLEQSVCFEDFLKFCARALNAGSGLRRRGRIIEAWIDGLRRTFEHREATHLNKIRRRLKRSPILASGAALFGLIVAVGLFISTRRAQDPREGDVPGIAVVGPEEAMQGEVLPWSSETPLSEPPEEEGVGGEENPSGSGGERGPGTAQQVESHIAGLRESPPGRSGSYAIQIGSFRSGKAAAVLEEKLRARGYPVFVTTAQIPAKGVMHRVRVGAFRSREEALRFGKELREREPFITSFMIMANRP